MRPCRLLIAAGLIGVILAGALNRPPVAMAESKVWTDLGDQPAAATARVATPLADGAVLLTGGGGEGGDAFPDAVRFDPAAGGWRRVADMLTPRYDHAAITLNDGRVLIAGGNSIGGGAASDGYVNTAELYDPVADRWTATGAMVEDRARGFAARLPDGRVLVGGGYNGNIYGGVALLNTAEIYDPATGRWSAAAPMRTGRGARVATALPDGTILVIGGDGAQIGMAVAAAERYDPATDRWLDTARPLVERAGQAAVALADGSVLIAGGYRGVNDGNANPIAEAERYVPTADRWAGIGALPFPLVVSVAAALPDGGVLIIGVRREASAPSGLLAAARYDWLTGIWAAVEPPPGFTAIRTATTLPDGRVLVTGNYRDPRTTVQGPPGAPVSALYGAGLTAKPPCFDQTGQCVRGPFLAQWLRSGGLAVNGLPLTGEISETLEDGKRHTVQYFERVRMEYHPENDPPYSLLLGQFGRQILATVPNAPTARAAPLPGQTYFDETGHNVAPDFADYWARNGGLAQFGYPLSEEFDEFIQNGVPGEGGVYRVQYFERARFERHPENEAPHQILLGQFGRRVLDEAR